MEFTTEDLGTLRGSLAFGIGEIDVQHFALFELIDRLEASVTRKDRVMRVHEVLDDLDHWARVHFSVEESLMGVMEYPRVDEHRMMHRSFLTTLSAKKAKALRGDVVEIAAAWLRQWLEAHINVEDRHYVEFFRGQHPAHERVAA